METHFSNKVEYEEIFVKEMQIMCDIPKIGGPTIAKAYVSKKNLDVF